MVCLLRRIWHMFYLLALFVTYSQGNHGTFLNLALEQLKVSSGNNFSYCNLLIIEKQTFWTYETCNDSQDPVIILQPELITIKDKVFTVCDNIVVILEEGGKWLDWLPVDHNIVFVSHNLDWVGQFKMISRLKKSLYYLIDANGKATMYQRKSFLSNGLTRVICTGQVGACSDSNLMRPPEKFEGLDFPAVAFEFSPYSLPDFEKGDHEGFEYEIVATIAKVLGLNLVVRPPSTGVMWGWEKDDGNYTGLLGDLQHSVAEIGWANLFITNDRARVMDFTDWYLQDPSCFLYKKSEPYTGIHSLIFPLKIETWFAILFSLVAVNLFFVFHSVFWGQQEVALDTLMMYEAAVTFTNSQSLTHYLPNEGLRVFNAFYLLCMMVLAYAYSGSLISFFSVEVYPTPPKTFDEIAGIVEDKDLNVHVCCRHIWEAMEDSTMDSFKTMMQPDRRVEYVEGHMRDALIDTDKGEEIYVYPNNGLEILRRLNSDAVPYDNLGIMRDCFLPTHIAFGLSLNSPFKTIINLKLNQLKEAGVVSKLIEDGYALVGHVSGREGGNIHHRVHNQEVKLVRILGLFQVCGYAAIVTFIAFISEHLCWRWKSPCGWVGRSVIKLRTKLKTGMKRGKQAVVKTQPPTPSSQTSKYQVTTVYID